MAEPRFIHLRVHSDFSMIDGLAKVKPIIKKASELQMPALAITDFTNLCGLVKFYYATHDAGIKPIIGADFKVQSEELGDELFDLTILAANNEGYKNLTLLISEAYQRGHVQHQPVIDKEWLIKHKDGLILLSGGKTGDVGKALLKGNQNMVEQCVAFYQTYFPDSYYLELVRTGRSDEEAYLHFAIELAEKAQLPVVATNDVRLLSADQFEAHEIRVAIHDGYTLADPNRPKNYSAQQYLRSEEEMCELFADIPEALENSVEIAKRCNVTVRLGEYFLPNFPTGELSTEDFLIVKSKEGLEERLEFLFPDPDIRAERRPEYDERLDIELEVINQMGFPGYFLIVMEFIQWSKDNGVPVGPGRGSGAGSLVAYALKITDLDPLEFDLLFERFLNPERVSMPDFDVDFCMDKRDQVIDHVADMYGRDAVSQIITFGTMAAKAVIRDVGRVLGHPYGFVDRISKLVPAEPGMTLAKAFDAEPQLQQSYDSDEEVKDLIDMCRILEGVTRNAGKHAGGVVISPTTITDFAPLYCDAEGHHPVTQFDKNDVESAGLVKFDFLGLRTLTIIDWALGMINPRLEAQGKDPVNIAALPMADQKSFTMLQRSETTAVFQLESRGMKDLIKRLQPDCFEDMIALVALFRPGPLQSGMVDNFIDRKHGREAVSYPDEKWQHESLKDILDPTYGIILYQEQVMQIAQVLAGYTLGGADMLRRAMGKKKPEEMAKQRAVFEAGAIKNGVDGELSMKIFDLVEKFAGYGFNKSHSAAYALVSYQTLWLKAHYPAEFMAAVMTADMDNTDKIIGLVDECHRMKLKLLPPDVNKGLYRFNVDDQGAIVYGIGAVKGVGEGPIENIIAAREAGGHFKDLFDFCARIDTKKVNKRVLERLIKSGAMDRLGPNRASMMASLDDAIRAASQHHQAEAFGQTDMFGVLTEAPEEVEHKYANIPEWPDKVWLEGERETLGLYLIGHPINAYLSELKHYTTWRLKDAQPTRRDGAATVAGLVIAARVMTTKRGTRIGLLTLDDRSGRMEVMLFSEALERYLDLIETDRIVVVTGQVSFDDYNGGLRMSAREVLDISDAREKHLRGLAISVTEQQIDDKFFARFSEILEPHKAGTVPVNVYYQRSNARAKLTLGTEWRITPADQLISDLKILLGEKQVELEFN
ncbi:DNA polymerase III subunit alpha [Photobacterium damselae subsp. piscicida]|uniref:DNA polymerase III subunit alpha n=1 Tax=Photobacterium damsela subsp. piscicida TaxID=38294 RepID=A0A1V1V589_PHODP|nr:DNA polymerase III subunit alpha [Photobacterium damselae]MBE8128517.1 DNA polymerase III subunit alpha [Photobacterium damselae subsp. piscicida]PSV79094.1 DNA polymerase III subunit alpha [Photobacterium damselae]PSW83768.1 DNA polymerase III subunit alpha [Photobacterium damselae]QOD53220.1 DNA polymerase III subunit alpha [Photobacterium damselae subsp. piscicida]QOD57058.1 DNA polymerase III subunit alpha [Photobacterium damselae subsp. piscicida]